MRVSLLIGTLSLIMPVLQGSAATLYAQGQIPKSVVLRGAVESVKITRGTSSSAYVAVKLRLELVNTGATPVIFLKREPLFPGGALAKTPEDLGTSNVLARSYGGPSNDISPEWAALRSSLDQPSPPPGETRTLTPGESWTLETSIGFPVPIDPIKKGTFSSATENLAVIQQLPQVWLQVACEVWPFNVELPAPGPEREKLKFGRELQKRWNDFGLLWLETIYSEPIPLNVTTATLTR